MAGPIRPQRFEHETKPLRSEETQALRGQGRRLALELHRTQHLFPCTWAGRSKSGRKFNFHHNITVSR